jgi:outer membrane biosynthesis protein TonB
MKRSVVLFLTVALLLMITPRLPAPIVETPETPTPAPEQSEAPKPKTKHSAKTRPSDVESSAKSETRPAATPKPPREGPAGFAGTWSGKINQGLLGHTPTTLKVDSAATSVELSRNLGGGTRSVTSTGNTISWHTGIVGEIAWTLTPSGDGQTAQVTMKGLLVHDSATFRRRLAPETGAKH